MSDRIVVKIEKIVQQGFGLGKTDAGAAYYVPFSVPGDAAEIEVVDSERKLASLKSLLVPSCDRVVPPCPYFGCCGGCQLQALRYESQLEAKKGLLKDALMRFGAIDLDVEPEVVPSPQVYGYRSRVRLKRNSGGAEIGYFAANSHKLVPIANCRIAVPAICAWIERYAKDADLRQLFGQSQELEITAYPGDTCVLVANDQRTWLFDSTTGARIEGEPTVRRIPHVDGTYLYMGSRGFVQANPFVNQAMVRAACNLLKEEQDSILELFSGNGNFTLPLARRCARVTAIEVVGEAIGRARRAAEELGLSSRIEFLHKGALAGLELKRRDGFYEAVLLDPPREGASLEVMNALLAYAPKKILYVSCHAIRLAHELRPLLRKDRYRIGSITIFDQFPQTSHIEAMVLLRRTR